MLPAKRTFISTLNDWQVLTLLCFQITSFYTYQI